MTRISALLAIVAALLLWETRAARAQPVDTGHLEAELVSRETAVAPGGVVTVALRQKIDKGWHTYWRNAGDSGEATRIAWRLPPGWSAGEIIWPAPHRQPIGPLMNYGYTGEVLLPVGLKAPRDAPPGSKARLVAEVDFLVCEEICIPERATLSLDMPVVPAAPHRPSRWAKPIERALAQAPRATGLAATFSRKGDKVELAVAGAPLASADLTDAYFFPYAGDAVKHAAPQSVERGPRGLTLALAPASAFERGAAPERLAGVLSVGERSYEISAGPGTAPPGSAGLGAPPRRSPAPPSFGLSLAALFALAGGLLLNLMPCVFPVLAMKAATLSGHAHAPAEARRQGIAYGAGVMATFIALAAALVAFKSAGAAVGWGFQLQSPQVVAGLSLLMLLVALNLSGLFEAGISLQGAGSAQAGRGGAVGAFLTGALAVVVAAPCTAPFMAPALGWALVQGPAATLAVFGALGVGFAAPFVAVAFAPKILARLPRPGPWMQGLRRALAFPMYGASAWLAWVLAVQAGDAPLAGLFAAAVILAAAAWLFGLAQRRRLAGGSSRALGAGALVLAVAAGAAAFGVAVGDGDSPPAVSTAEGQVPTFEPYTPERLAAARAAGRPVFVNYTAAWCVTCQVNERLALSQPGVARAFHRTGAVYLKADWTRKDAAIAADLAAHGRAGVPLYLIYEVGGVSPRVLPQILTERIVVRALDRAAASRGAGFRSPQA